MNVVVKLGGSLLAGADRWDPMLEQVLRLRRQGHGCILVHGGGRKLTAFLQERGIESRFVQGLRVTDAATLDAALMVLGGYLNRRLVAEIERLGGRALGICGDAGAVRAIKSLPENPQGADLGWVGEVAAVDGALLRRLQELELVVVMASMATDGKGNFYNINADVLAAACAGETRADRLVFLTDVAGVLDGAGNRIPALARREIEDLAARGVISGGMLPKLRSCRAALERGVGRVCIVPGGAAGGLMAVMRPGAMGIGTEIQ